MDVVEQDEVHEDNGDEGAGALASSHASVACFAALTLGEVPVQDQGSKKALSQLVVAAGDEDDDCAYQFVLHWPRLRLAKSLVVAPNLPLIGPFRRDYQKEVLEAAKATCYWRHEYLKEAVLASLAGASSGSEVAAEFDFRSPRLPVVALDGWN